MKWTEVSEDEIKDLEDELQKLTDKYIKEVDKAIEEKSKDSENSKQKLGDQLTNIVKYIVDISKKQKIKTLFYLYF